MLICQLLLVSAIAAASDQKTAVYELSAGDYSVRVDRSGLAIAHRGERICFGSDVTVFKPRYQGALLSLHQGWPKARVTRSGDGRSLSIDADFDSGKLQYVVAVSAEGVRTHLRLSLAEGVQAGPVEYPAFQLPPEIVRGATIEVYDPAGGVLHTGPVPESGKRGALGPGGDVLAVRTPTRIVEFTSESGRSVSPFDARVPQYGDRQGVWVFSSAPVAAGRQCQVSLAVSVRPARPATSQATGTIRIVPDVPALTIATLPDPTPREKLAADELAAYLARITGRRLDRREVGASRVGQGVIAVGRLAIQAGLVTAQDLAPVERDGYVVKVGGGRAAVVGWRDLGTVYGAYALLGRLGVKFYAPGCESVPMAENLLIPELDLRARPFYEFRNVTHNLKLGHTPDDDMGDPRLIGESGNIVHSADFLVPFDKHAATHPEYFALQKDGKRLRRDPAGKRFDVHLCLSNPEVQRISAERLLYLIGRQPERSFFGVSQGDGFAWCECEKCQALDAVPGKDMTDRLLVYVNFIARQVARKYPDKRILTLAYTNATSPPPSRVMPEPNVMVQYCPYPHRTACQSHDLFCPKNRQGLADLEGWVAKCPRNMYIFDYPRGYKIWAEPFGSFYAMKGKLDFYAQHGIRGIFYCGVPTNFRDLFVFVQSRLLWDPKADVERLVDEFLAAYYGQAAGPLREYFDFMHREVQERQVHQMCEGANPGLVTAEYAQKALDMFQRAERAVADDRVALYRVRAEKLFVLFADVNERNLGNGKATDRKLFADRLAEFCRIARSSRLATIGRRDAGVVSDWLERISGLRPELTPWFQDPLLDQLLDDPSATLARHREVRKPQKP